MNFSNGDKFMGKYVKGCRQGAGVLQFKDGSVYNGEWMNDET
jgi:hypothetical protein